MPRYLAEELGEVEVRKADEPYELVRLALPTGSFSPSTEIQPILTEVAEAVRAVIEADAVCITLYDPLGGHLLPQAHLGLSEEQRETGARLCGTGPHRTVISTRRPLLIDDVEGRTDGLLPQHLLGFRAAVLLPLATVGEELVGVLAIFFAAPRHTSERELRVLEAYARHAAGMIERARLHSETRELMALERQRAMQLHVLAETALALNQRTTMQEVLGTVTERAMQIIGTHQAVTSHLVHGWSQASTHVCLSDKYAEYREYDEVPKGRGVLNYVTRENKVLRLSAEQLEQHPEWRGLQDATGHPPLPNYLAAPLIGRDGRNIGLIQLSDKVDGTDFSEEDEAMLVQLAQMAALVIENTALLERERVARAAAEQRAELRELLSEASRALATSLELDDTLDALTRVVVPAIADWCSVRMLHDDGTLRLVRLTAADRETENMLREFLARVPLTLQQPYGAGAVARTGRSQLIPVVTEEILSTVATPDVGVQQLRSLGVSTAIVVPLVADGKTIGAMALARTEPKPYTETELEFAEDLAQRAGLALSNATKYALERNVAAILQRSLLPQALPDANGVQTAVRYRPGESGARIGGDWYDLIDLGQGRLGLVVGDVMGRGVSAAAIMGQLRAAVRAYALEGHSPAAILRRLDRMVQSLGEFELTTCCFCLLDKRSGRISMASAGHPPPVLIDGEGRASFAAIASNAPLGAGEAGYEETAVEVEPGSTLLLYTDGLVESRDCPIDRGMEELLRAASGPRAASPEALCDRVLRGLGRDQEHDDDIALIALALRAVPVLLEPEDSRLLRLPPVPESARAARLFVAEQLQEQGLDAYLDDVTLVVSELVTNAIRHARTDLSLEVSVGETVRVSVVDGSDQVPEVRETFTAEREWGRGLLTIDRIAKRWGWERVTNGKRVWVEVPVDRHERSHSGTR